ncbi:fucoxanthin chlorophyll a/c protein [Chaetoceros tenuissimus]|uniref:Fucoxanthin chlorophyll a/c protein n=1 Tax=Chaetoceros tenuissimus TaxID=426638 RepID=A0AAD3CV71_9STRA|nr:fucoxanthin chlorophyll a/c protein [Chaetoceros tenuissimus]
MKATSAILAFFLAQSASAFTPSAGKATLPSLSSTVAGTDEIKQTFTSDDAYKYETTVNTEQKFQVKSVDKNIYDPKKRVQTGRYNDKEMSIAVPFLKRPTKLDGTHAGDVGFDPLGLSENLDMYTMMEAEVRHARLAMLAVVGWPLSELFGPNFMLHGKAHLAPSVLNGFDPLSFIAVAAIFGGAGYFEYKTSLRRVDDKRIGMKHKEDMANVWKYGVPGDYNFDPLNFYSMFGDTADGRKAMRELEISHGRWAMLGITGFAAWEALTGHAVVENNLFFHPNGVIPALAAAYLAFGFFYEVKNTDQYLFQIEMTSEGQVRKENLQRRAELAASEAEEKFEEALPYFLTAVDVATDTAKDLKNKYEKVTDDYTNNVMKNIREE